MINAGISFMPVGYSDDLVVLLSLLNYLSNFENASQLREVGENNAEYFNTSCCVGLSEHFRVMVDDPLWRVIRVILTICFALALESLINQEFIRC